jgi:hypothetical protein
MFDRSALEREFFEGLVRVDTAIVELAAGQPCGECGGPLHRGDYPRKPRGGLIGAAAEAFEVRFSLCCGREGCRRRATPPSVRFLGRRVYVGAVVVVASDVALAVATATEAVRRTGVPARTTRRWLRWWRGPFTTTASFMALAARLVPAPERRWFPTSLLERLASDPADRVAKLLACLAPITTATWPDGSRLVRDAM